MIASGDWRQYFTENAPLTSAYPISYTFRNLRDGSIAKVSESTEYNIKECSLKGTAFSGFILDSFETQNDFDSWSSNDSAVVSLSWGDPTTPQSIFYGYVHAKHTNTLTVNDDFLYKVSYLMGPPHFQGDKADFYKGELSFWYRPDEVLYNSTAGKYCYDKWVFYPFVKTRVCIDNEVKTTQTLNENFKVTAYDDVTYFDQVVLRGGTPPFSVLTLTYNPLTVNIEQQWKRHEISLTNDNTVNSHCDPAHPESRGGGWSRTSGNEPEQVRAGGCHRFPDQGKLPGATQVLPGCFPSGGGPTVRG